MTMMIIPGLSGAVDICDITLIIPNGATKTTLYLLGNAALLCDADPGTVFAAINSGQPFMEALSTTDGFVGCNLQNVLRIVPATNPLWSVWQMEANGGTFTVNNLDVAAAIALVNAAPRCGGAPPPPPVVQTGYADAGDYSPLFLGGGPGVTGTVLGDGGTFARVGQLANAGAPEAGDTVTLGIKVRAQITPGNQLSLSFNDGLPGPIDGGRIAASIIADYTSGTTITTWEVESTSDNQFVIKGQPATVAAFDAKLDITVVYQVAEV